MDNNNPNFATDAPPSYSGGLPLGRSGSATSGGSPAVGVGGGPARVLSAPISHASLFTITNQQHQHQHFCNNNNNNNGGGGGGLGQGTTNNNADPSEDASAYFHPLPGFGCDSPAVCSAAPPPRNHSNNNISTQNNYHHSTYRRQSAGHSGSSLSTAATPLGAAAGWAGNAPRRGRQRSVVASLVACDTTQQQQPTAASTHHIPPSPSAFAGATRGGGENGQFHQHRRVVSPVASNGGSRGAMIAEEVGSETRITVAAGVGGNGEKSAAEEEVSPRTKGSPLYCPTSNNTKSTVVVADSVAASRRRASSSAKGGGVVSRAIASIFGGGGSGVPLNAEAGGGASALPPIATSSQSNSNSSGGGRRKGGGERRLLRDRSGSRGGGGASAGVDPESPLGGLIKAVPTAGGADSERSFRGEGSGRRHRFLFGESSASAGVNPHHGSEHAKSAPDGENGEGGRRREKSGGLWRMLCCGVSSLSAAARNSKKASSSASTNTTASPSSTSGRSVPLLFIFSLQVALVAGAFAAVILVLSEQQRVEFERALHKQLALQQDKALTAIVQPLRQRKETFEHLVDRYISREVLMTGLAPPRTPIASAGRSGGFSVAEWNERDSPSNLFANRSSSPAAAAFGPLSFVDANGDNYADLPPWTLPKYDHIIPHDGSTLEDALPFYNLFRSMPERDPMVHMVGIVNESAFLAPSPAPHLGLKPLRTWSMFIVDHMKIVVITYEKARACLGTYPTMNPSTCLKVTVDYNTTASLGDPDEWLGRRGAWSHPGVIVDDVTRERVLGMTFLLAPEPSRRPRSSAILIFRLEHIKPIIRNATASPSTRGGLFTYYDGSTYVKYDHYFVTGNVGFPDYQPEKSNDYSGSWTGGETPDPVLNDAFREAKALCFTPGMPPTYTEPPKGNATSSWQNHRRTNPCAESPVVFDITSGGVRYTCSAARALYYDDENFDWMLVQYTPRKDFFAASDAARLTGIIIGCAGALLVLGSCVTIWFAVRLPLLKLKHQMRLAAAMRNDRIAEMNSNPSDPRGLRPVLSEVADLVVAFKAMNEKLLQARPFLPQSLLAAVHFENGADDSDSTDRFFNDSGGDGNGEGEEEEDKGGEEGARVRMLFGGENKMNAASKQNKKASTRGFFDDADEGDITDAASSVAAGDYFGTPAEDASAAQHARVSINIGRNINNNAYSVNNNNEGGGGGGGGTETSYGIYGTEDEAATPSHANARLVGPLNTDDEDDDDEGTISSTTTTSTTNPRDRAHVPTTTCTGSSPSVVTSSPSAGATHLATATAVPISSGGGAFSPPDCSERDEASAPAHHHRNGSLFGGGGGGVANSSSSSTLRHPNSPQFAHRSRGVGGGRAGGGGSRTIVASHSAAHHLRLYGGGTANNSSNNGNGGRFVVSSAAAAVAVLMERYGGPSMRQFIRSSALSYAAAETRRVAVLSINVRGFHAFLSACMGGGNGSQQQRGGVNNAVAKNAATAHQHHQQSNNNNIGPLDSATAPMMIMNDFIFGGGGGHHQPQQQPQQQSAADRQQHLFTVQSLLTKVIEASVKRERGIVDYFHGDRFVCGFNTVAANGGSNKGGGGGGGGYCGNPARSAGMAALKIIEEMREATTTNFNGGNNTIGASTSTASAFTAKPTIASVLNGAFPHGLSMGLAAGRAIVCNHGTDTMQRLAVLGPAVSEAIRLEEILSRRILKHDEAHACAAKRVRHAAVEDRIKQQQQQQQQARPVALDCGVANNKEEPIVCGGAARDGGGTLAVSDARAADASPLQVQIGSPLGYDFPPLQTKGAAPTVAVAANGHRDQNPTGAGFSNKPSTAAAAAAAVDNQTSQQQQLQHRLALSRRFGAGGVDRMGVGGRCLAAGRTVQDLDTAIYCQTVGAVEASALGGSVAFWAGGAANERANGGGGRAPLRDFCGLEEDELLLMGMADGNNNNDPKFMCDNQSGIINSVALCVEYSKSKNAMMCPSLSAKRYGAAFEGKVRRRLEEMGSRKCVAGQQDQHSSSSIRPPPLPPQTRVLLAVLIRPVHSEDHDVTDEDDDDTDDEGDCGEDGFGAAPSPAHSTTSSAVFSSPTGRGGGGAKRNSLPRSRRASATGVKRASSAGGRGKRRTSKPAAKKVRAGGGGKGGVGGGGAATARKEDEWLYEVEDAYNRDKYRRCNEAVARLFIEGRLPFISSDEEETSKKKQQPQDASVPSHLSARPPCAPHAVFSTPTTAFFATAAPPMTAQQRPASASGAQQRGAVVPPILAEAPSSPLPFPPPTTTHPCGAADDGRNGSSGALLAFLAPGAVAPTTSGANGSSGVVIGIHNSSLGHCPPPYLGTGASGTNTRASSGAADETVGDEAVSPPSLLGGGGLQSVYGCIPATFLPLHGGGPPTPTNANCLTTPPPRPPSGPHRGLCNTKPPMQQRAASSSANRVHVSPLPLEPLCAIAHLANHGSATTESVPSRHPEQRPLLIRTPLQRHRTNFSAWAAHLDAVFAAANGDVALAMDLLTFD